jgi:hypothetical protein
MMGHNGDKAGVGPLVSQCYVESTFVTVMVRFPFVVIPSPDYQQYHLGTHALVLDLCDLWPGIVRVYSIRGIRLPSTFSM